MNVSRLSLGSFLAALCVSGCATSTAPVALSPVGPAAAPAAAMAASGTLTVYTAFQVTPPGPNDPTYRHYHTPYQLYDGAGQLIRTVRNHAGAAGDDPTTVQLPEGSYRVEAQANGLGRVTVPITVVAGRPTVVHLDSPVDPRATAVQ